MSSSFDLYTEQGKWRDFDKLFEFIFNNIKQEYTIIADFSKQSALDLGCGIGFSTRSIAKRFGKVTGVDGDIKLIQRAKDAGTSEIGNAIIKFEHCTDIVTYDAFGERFDFIFASYVLGYMGDVFEALQHLATMLKPNGKIAILEIQGLFSIHQPLNNPIRVYFEKFDKEILSGVGYNSQAGRQMESIIANVPGLKRILLEDWSDVELSFNGPLVSGSPVWLAWEERWKRLWPLMSQCGAQEGVREAFFDCLSHSEHYCEKPIKLLVATKTGYSPKAKDYEDDTNENVDASVD